MASRRHRACARKRAGFTLLELVLALAVFAVLAALAYASYGAIVQRGRVAQAMADIAELEIAIERYRNRNGLQYPDTLAQVDPDGRLDPWGNPYHYNVLTGPRAIAAARKDRRLNPLNSDYDLFSAGRNGVFTAQISQRESLDDVIRARGGGYIGLAEDF